MTLDDILERSMPVPFAGCWIWMGWSNRDGYGMAQKNGRYDKRTAVHRIAWENVRGPIPVGVRVCHQCDIPSCVNPDHLFLGTPAENSADMVCKERSARGSRNGRAKLSSDSVRAIRIDLRSGTSRSEIAETYSVSVECIRAIANRKTWRHIS